ncbi:unnamed protein product [Gongylonema pulchrum]|uniref:Phosphotransferase n=1 Tax=Gongylonema pulchrum TaxID=637853 RepID=A0A3P6RQF9_9BILA|nr:unnamed protein product [Gongylonema pulchrum]
MRQSRKLWQFIFNSFRAAHLCAAGIACLINRIKKPLVTVGVDGSVYRFHPNFGRIMNAKISELVEKQYRVCLFSGYA